MHTVLRDVEHGLCKSFLKTRRKKNYLKINETSGGILKNRLTTRKKNLHVICKVNKAMRSRGSDILLSSAAKKNSWKGDGQEGYMFFRYSFLKVLNG